MSAVDRLRRAKHRLWLAKRHTEWISRDVFDRVNRWDDHLRDHTFDAQRYVGRDGQWALDSFWRFDAADEDDPGPVRRQIFAFWFGSNEMSANRARCLDALVRRNPHSEVTLVTADTLADYVVAGDPLHPAFEYLSAVHQSDYLRGYFMHHHGGGYSDIKEPFADWSPAFTRIEDDPNIWMVGYQEPSSKDCARIESNLGRDLRRRSGLLAGNGAFICRPGTPLTTEWTAEQERRLSYYEPLLRQHPAQDAYGTNPDYPLPWTILQAQVLQPLQLKYGRHLALDSAVRPDLDNHR